MVEERRVKLQPYTIISIPSIGRKVAIPTGEFTSHEHFSRLAAAIRNHPDYAGAKSSGKPKEDRIYFKSSDGSTHSVPADQIHEAMKIDPKLTIINQ